MVSIMYKGKDYKIRKVVTITKYKLSRTPSMLLLITENPKEDANQKYGLLVDSKKFKKQAKNGTQSIRLRGIMPAKMEQQAPKDFLR